MRYNFLFLCVAISYFYALQFLTPMRYRLIHPKHRFFFWAYPSSRWATPSAAPGNVNYCYAFATLFSFQTCFFNQIPPPVSHLRIALIRCPVEHIVNNTQEICISGSQNLLSIRQWHHETLRSAEQFLRPVPKHFNSRTLPPRSKLTVSLRSKLWLLSWCHFFEPRFISGSNVELKKTPKLRSFLLGYPNNFEPYIMRKKSNSSFFVIISDGTTFCHFYNSPKTNSCTIKWHQSFSIYIIKFYGFIISSCNFSIFYWVP